jgi:nickel/cobalt transporter (NiCoT) family protein
MSAAADPVLTVTRLSPVGTAASGGFLYLIAAINIVILLAIVKVFREMRTPWCAILCLPILFAAGMSLMDSIDGAFAYGWALSKPVRKVFYNLTVTGLSVAVALVIGTIEVGGLISSELDLSGSFWN